MKKNLLKASLLAVSLSIMGGGVFAQPTVKAPTPAHPADDVISIHSDAYEPATWWWWGEPETMGWFTSPTRVVDATVEGIDIVKFENFDWTFFNFYGQGGAVDCSEMDKMHLDVWIEDETSFAVEFGNSVACTPLLTGCWNSFDISLADFGATYFDDNEGITKPVNWAEMGWIAFVDGSTTATVYMDNFYFYTGVPIVNRNALVLAVKTASTTLDEEDYTAETWAPLEAALAAAEEIINDEDATQTQVNKAEADLEAARKALVEKTISGICDLAADGSIAGYYSILGVELPAEPASGVFIVKYANGKTVKFVK